MQKLRRPEFRKFRCFFPWRRPVRHGLRRQAGSLVRTSLGNLFVTALAQPSVKKMRADPGKGIVGIAVGTGGFGRLKCVEESTC